MWIDTLLNGSFCMNLIKCTLLFQLQEYAFSSRNCSVHRSFLFHLPTVYIHTTTIPKCIALIHGRQILLELRSSLLSLFSAHRYFLNWLRDEIFPAHSTLNDLKRLKVKHLWRKLQYYIDKNDTNVGRKGAPPRNFNSVDGTSPNSKELAQSLSQTLLNMRSHSQKNMQQDTDEVKAKKVLNTNTTKVYITNTNFKRFSPSTDAS